jgi:glycerol-3-phosphate dehydrogenase
MVPKTDDKRVLFAIPWHDRVLVGTTDTPVSEIQSEPRPFEAEIDFLLTHTARYLIRAPKRQDILSAFAGLRPLVKPSGATHNSLIPRDHMIRISDSGLITIAGGKWTTYRKMAEDAVNRATEVGGLEQRSCRTRELSLHGALPLTATLSLDVGEGEPRSSKDWLSVYGSDAAEIRKLAEEKREWAERLDPQLPYIGAEVIWAARQEMARTVKDVLARRTRALFLDASASLRCAPKVAALLGKELGRSAEWTEAQMREYERLVQNYLPNA